MGSCTQSQAAWQDTRCCTFQRMRSSVPASVAAIGRDCLGISRKDWSCSQLNSMTKCTVKEDKADAQEVFHILQARC